MGFSRRYKDSSCNAAPSDFIGSVSAFLDLFKLLIDPDEVQSKMFVFFIEIER
jgi:hypothetical protein